MGRDEAFESAFRASERSIRITGSKTGAMVGLLLVPAGISLDFFVYPDQLFEFFMMRISCDLVIGLLLALHFTESGRTWIATLTFSWLLAAQAMIAIMIHVTDGAHSSYYAGLNLAILASGILLPGGARETIWFTIATLVLYLAACLLHPDQPLAWDILFNNLYFLSLTGIISTVAVIFNARRRFSEFRLSYELEQKNKQMAELDRLKSQFFANVSHELRTPLTLILAPVQDLLATGTLPERLHSRLEVVKSNALRLLKLVNDLLEVIRLEEGKAKLDLRPLDLNRLLGGICESMTHLSTRKGLELERSLPAEPLVILGDAGAVEKIFVNLLSNAVKFTEPGGRISIRSRAEQHLALVEIRDTGIGISPEELPYIFNRFHQADGSSTRKYQGTGLGLALVKELAEKMGGTVRAQSTPGRGTQLTIGLPLAKEELHMETNLSFKPADALQAMHREAAWTGAATPVSREECIAPAYPETEPTESDAKALALVVDDEPELRNYLVDLLSDEYRVLQAADGTRALELARSKLPQLLLLDLMLPELDGLQVCKALKDDARTTDIKIMLLTARVDEEAKLTALEHGADDFLTKPYSSVEVKTRLRNLLRTATLQQDLRDRNQELESTLGELKRTQSQLIHSEKLNALGSLAAGLLHEVNNPLNYSFAALQLAQMDPTVESDPDLKETMDDIRDGMERIKAIVTDLRAFAYPSEGEKQSPFSLQAALNSALNFTGHELKGINVTRTFDTDCRVLGSQSHIVQVLVNLLSNAAKAIAKTDRPGRIEIGYAPLDERRIRVSVKDNGSGMDDKTLSRIFEPFFTTRDVGEGMGMGLSICHTIIANHGGMLEARSKPGEWSEFSFDLTTS